MSVTLSLVTIHRALIVRRAIQMSRAREQDGILLRNQSPSPSPSPYTPPDARFGFTPASERFSYFSSSTSPYLSPKAPSPSYRPVPSHESLVPVSRPNTSKSPSGWVILHLLGTFVGLTGLIAVIRADFGNNRELRNLTYGFVITTIVITIGAASAFYMKGWDKWMANERGGRLCFNTGMKAGGAALGAFLASLGVLGALYSDLVLGAVAHNWTGMPNEDNALLYWSWFISKRIPLFAY
ncbi:hypothetical protein P152DRAFT_476588 [Eremomyces bilateralis CBS 781.70]|uniref:Uncharacterized protein n=1 Tax=Eremomyces bilateralis CBS 781.70 TaxID=1392243 RepID=A0A6G1FU95_9PEZI|nr:uncharacterized protein P152DRAFT_476588 [Eremomyces bilateralis CBS 781.70]KAF1809231.1 hypothetical protein P152DRAFT_476588 [Eremomyces bilateralis CBS 781.70]